MNLEITRLNHNGQGIGTYNGKIVFVSKTIPGDIVKVEIKKEHKNFIEGIVKEYQLKSSIREQIKCPYYEKCGGCQLMGLSYEEQLKYKKEKVINIIKKYANIDINPTIKESPQYNYRNKITIQVKNNQLGLYQQNSNDLILVNHCLLISKNMNNLIKIIKNTLNLKNINQIIIREANKKLMIQFLGSTKEEELIKKISPYVASLYLNEKLLSGTSTITETLDNYNFIISPTSFFQVNKTQTINLYNQVKKYLGPNNKDVLDLYCGTGTIGIYVSDYCQKVTGIELNKSAAKDGKQNVKLNKVNNVEIKQGDVGKILEAKNTYDAIIVDPPRSGLDKKTKATLLKIKSPKLIYVSCDPITLARDLNDLKTIYNLEEITLFDMFPNTYHVESVVLLILKK